MSASKDSDSEDDCYMLRQTSEGLSVWPGYKRDFVTWWCLEFVDEGAAYAGPHFRARSPKRFVPALFDMFASIDARAFSLSAVAAVVDMRNLGVGDRSAKGVVARFAAAFAFYFRELSPAYAASVEPALCFVLGASRDSWGKIAAEHGEPGEYDPLARGFAARLAEIGGA